MEVTIFMYILAFALMILFSFVGFILGCKYQENQHLLREIKKINVDKSIDEVVPFLQAMQSGKLPADNIKPVGKKDVSQSRVMKYPTPQEVRKRREAEALRTYAEDAEKNPRESGTYVL